MCSRNRRLLRMLNWPDLQIIETRNFQTSHRLEQSEKSMCQWIMGQKFMEVVNSSKSHRPRRTTHLSFWIWLSLHQRQLTIARLSAQQTWTQRSRCDLHHSLWIQTQGCLHTVSRLCLMKDPRRGKMKKTLIQSWRSQRTTLTILLNRILSWQASVHSSQWIEAHWVKHSCETWARLSRQSKDFSYSAQTGIQS